mgnify:CR=1 FL=1
MPEEVLNNVEVEEQKSFVLPAGGTIIKKTVNMSAKKNQEWICLEKIL